MTTIDAAARPALVLTRVRAAGRRRSRIAIAGLLAAVVAVAVLSLTMGGYAIPVGDVVATLAGQGTARHEFVVMELRLPRLLMGVLVGAAFGMSGALFQTVLGNPLASPDIIGITAGASVAAVLALLVIGLTGMAVAGVALAGGLVAAGAIYLLAWRDGVVGHRFVLIGIGVAFMADAVLGYLLTRSDVRDAQSALVWLVGSLGSARWDEVGVLALALAVLVPVAAALARPLRALQLGDDGATGLGVHAQRSRLALILAGVGLAAVATAAAGPVAFVAFVAAPIARRLCGGGGLALLPSALVGILVVTGSDLVALHLLPGDVQVPVGVVTGLIGSTYLLWLLAMSERRAVGA